MSSKVRKILREEYNRLKKGMERLLKPAKDREMPQPALQPYRRRKFPE